MQEANASNNSYVKTRWCVDSGANRDICRDISIAEGDPIPRSLVIGEAGRGHSFNSEAIGSVACNIDGKKLPLLTRTIFAKQIHENIMSVAEAVDKGFVMVFSKSGVYLYNPKCVMVKGEALISGGRDPKSRLFHFDLDAPICNIAHADNTSVIHAFSLNANDECLGENKAIPAKLSPLSLVPAVGISNSKVGDKWYERVHAARVTEGGDTYCPLPFDATMFDEDTRALLTRTYHEFKTDYDLWHPRLAHINQRLALLAKPDLKDYPKKCACKYCILGKFHKHSHSGKRPTQTEINWLAGEYITCDLFGPLLRSMGGGRYCAIYVDLASRFIWVHVISDKTGSYESTEAVFQDARARSGRPCRFFKTDGDGIFTGGEALRIYAKWKLRHIQSAPGDSASNDVAERAIRTMAELARTNLLHSGAPQSFWGEAICMVAYVWNIITVCSNTLIPGDYLSRTSLLEGHTRKYDLSHLRAFGTSCYYMLTVVKKGGKKDAMGPKARHGVIIGIEDNMPAYRVYDLERREAKRIPFAQVISHEGHYPLRDYSKWTEEEKALPESFIPSFDAQIAEDEFSRFGFSEKEKLELFSDFSSTREAYLYGNASMGDVDPPPPWGRATRPRDWLTSRPLQLT